MSNSEYDNSFIAESLPAFVSEAEEHTEMLEQLLLQLEDAPGDRELLDSLFRCAHTIKGSAGLFGLDKIVDFTHHVETLLDTFRSSKPLTPELSTLLLQCNDQLRVLVASVQDGHRDSVAHQQTRAALVLRLRAAYGDTNTLTLTKETASVSTQSGAIGDNTWRIKVAFGADTFRNGMDPMAILSYLRGLGRVCDISCGSGAVPVLESLDPESCHLQFKFQLITQAPREKIESAFSFVRDDCVLEIDLVDMRKIGEILLDDGVIEKSQLEAGLKAQSEMTTEDNVPLLGQILVDRGEVSPAELCSALQKQRGGPAKATHADDTRFIRVQADRLDSVINLLGELVIASAGASLLAHGTRNGKLIEANQQISDLVEEIRNGTLQLRMVPIGETFARFRRVVRDTAAELGKDIALEIVGGETELDKSMVERIADPLMHLVRNALDHGLETPAQRIQNGKPSQGTLTLSARHESGSVLICITDDGGGINREKVLARAWERGLVESGVTPPDADILKLIFEPGFSTAEVVTNLSGRGVGMDVVRRNIDALRGSIAIFSEPGVGSRIEIRLPLTLAIIDGFLISVGGSKFIFPLDAVVEVIENHSGATAQDASECTVMELRGKVLPVVSLRALYGIESAMPKRSSVVVVQSGGQRYGVMVDTLYGQYQTVIKPLSFIFRSLRGISGSTILGDGEVALIFDVNALSELAAVAPSGITQLVGERS